MDQREALLRQAAALDERVTGEGKAEEEQLRREAAGLRVRALGERPYPVLICATCFRLTGWLGSGDRCDRCIDRELRKAEYSDPGAGWVDLTGHAWHQQPIEVSPTRWKHVAASVGWRQPLREERVAIWMSHVEPGETGPVDPEDGFEIAVADRSEGEAPEGPDLLVRFFVRSVAFDGSRWRPLVGVGLPDPITPDVFPASLPIEQLAEAWNDFRGEVAEANRADWSAEEARRDRERDAGEERTRARREQQGTSRLLD
jgi:hypothetical protein